MIYLLEYLCVDVVFCLEPGENLVEFDEMVADSLVGEPEQVLLETVVFGLERVVILEEEPQSQSGPHYSPALLNFA